MQREIDEMREQLAGYIEATYHLSHPKTVAIRRALLERAGGISQEPYVESTPTYVGDRLFKDLKIGRSAQGFLSRLASAEHGNLLFDPPYEHQARALELSQDPASGGTGIVVTTGTGSGKTEAFLLPVMARLAEEAAERPDHFSERAVRALLLYPMNALVNDQLGRLRTLIGDESVRNWFKDAAGRPAKFGRYTGRTLYPGHRDAKRDQDRLKSLSYYLDLEDGAKAGDEAKASLLETLKRRGRWPSKPESILGANDGLRTWYGSKNQRWEDANQSPLRAIERLDDSELLTRHEMQAACPDLLVTNYSMLEYMLLRPIERSIFDETRDFFRSHPDEKFIFVLDEAHLYRGANGTEVAYLIRRFLDRLDLPLSRVVFICTSASFSEAEAAKSFASQLTGLDVSAFTVLTGRKKIVEGATRAASACVSALAGCRLANLASLDAEVRASVLAPLLAWRPAQDSEPILLTRMSGAAGPVTVRGLSADGSTLEIEVLMGPDSHLETEGRFVVVTDVRPGSGSVLVGRPGGLRLGIATVDGLTWENDDLARGAWTALRGLEVLGLLKNVTSGAIDVAGAPMAGSAKSLSNLADLLFSEGDAQERSKATDVLLELASLARPGPGETPLLPARVHLMFRGLPGLWACVDSKCADLAPDLHGGPTGTLYAQPRRHCTCGAQVLELHSCRSCGLAIASAFAGAPVGHQHLWADDGANYGGESDAVRPVHVCLEAPHPSGAGPATTSAAYLDVVTGRLNGEGGRVREVWHTPVSPGIFARCPRCEDDGDQISDLQTKGEEPFQQLVAVQVLEQPPRPESTAPLKGRKALVFSDGRQTASRLAGVMKTFAFRDSLRPLLIDGMSILEGTVYKPSLDDAPMALALSAAAHDVRLRPVGDEAGVLARNGSQAQDYLSDPEVSADDMRDLSSDTSARTPRSVFENLYAVLQDRHTGVNALALGSITAKLRKIDLARLEGLAPPTLAGESVDASRAAVIDLWLWSALKARAIRLSGTPADVEGGYGATAIAKWNGKFDKFVRKALTAAGHGSWIAQFEATGLALLREAFALQNEPTFQLSARKIRLQPGHATTWRRCDTCTAVSPANIVLSCYCPACGGRTRDIEPDTDQVFRSRKSFFRRSSERLAAGEQGFAPHQLIAEEHSAQLNDSNTVRAMSRNEAYELRFQDVPISQDGQTSDPIDVLSCTTTMEVGIDIGGLTAVALRNVPPGRANYQQRAGRAGRRGAGLSTVLMFCGADSHDQSFFKNPAPIVAGPAPDPVLNLDNPVIAERQAFAFLLGRFQQARIIGGTNANIFESLGRTVDFLTGTQSGFSLAGLKAWLIEHQDELRAEVGRLFVASCPALDADLILTRWPMLLEEKLGALHPPPTGEEAVVDGEDDELESDVPDNDRSGAGSAKLLDQLFALGLMPRYAFPTDVATFAVFEDDADAYRPKLLYSPQQALNAALAQYAPGHEVWIDGKRHLSLGIWSAFEEERLQAYRDRKLYFHCHSCDYAMLVEGDAGTVGQTQDCPACNAKAGMGPAQRWVRPVGFAHPPSVLATPPRIEGTTNSRPTRAKLDAPHFAPTLRVGGASWPLGSSWEAWRDNRDLVVTNRGTQTSQAQGFRYCTQCGRTEPADLDQSLRQLQGGGSSHARPRPRKLKEPDTCSGTVTSIVIGNQFKTDIAIFRLQTPSDWSLDPSRAATVIAAKSAVEALIRAASEDLEPGDIDGDYRFAPGANAASLLDLYIYDQAAGGAGFVKAAAADPVGLVTTALKILDDCTCEDSCYQCLRSYKNRFDHADLDRRLGADLLRACFFGVAPTVSDDWAAGALSRLCEDLNDSGAHYTVGDGGLVSGDGQGVILAHPFTPDAPGNASAVAFAKAANAPRAVDVLLVDRALPIATARALNKSDTSASLLQSATDGPPLFKVSELLAGAAPAGMPKVSVGPFEPGDFVMRLEARTLDGPLGDGTGPVPKGTPCLFRPFTGDPDPKQTYLLRRTDGRAFGATQNSWTVGRVQPSASGVRVRYRAAPDRLECASEVVAPADVVVPVALFVRKVT